MWGRDRPDALAGKALADMTDTAFVTHCLAGRAYRPAVMDQSVAEVGGFFRRQYLAQGAFNFDRVFKIVHKPHPVGQTDTVRIHNDSGFVKDIAEDEVCRFPADTGQGDKRLHRIRYLSAVLYQKRLGAEHDIPRLGSEKAAGVDVFLNFFNIGGGKGLKAGEAFKERGRDHIHPLIRALGGETDGEQQLIVLDIIQAALGQRVLFLESSNDFTNLFLSSHLMYPCSCLI